MRKKKMKKEKKRSRNTLPACQKLCGCSACLGYIQLRVTEEKSYTMSALQPKSVTVLDR